MNALAYPFAHETGLYFKGKREYTLPACGVCSICLAIFMIVCWLIIFVPVLGGQIRSSELKVGVLVTPGGIPVNLNAAGGYISSGPSYFAKLFGAEDLQTAPKLNIVEFVDQFKTIEVFGANSCDTVDG